MSEYQNWRLTRDGYIKRYGKNNKGSQNYSRKKYVHLNEKERMDLVDRLNFKAHKKTLEKISVENSFIPQKAFENYKQFLIDNHKSLSTTNSQWSAFVNHGIKCLQENFGPNPEDWKKNEMEWGSMLIKKGLSQSYIKEIIQSVNRFFKLSSQKYKGEVEQIILTPITRNQIRLHENRRLEKIRKAGGRNKSGYYIPKHDLDKILKNPPEDISGIIYIMYWYGLRIAEACAVPANIANRFTPDGIIIDRQLVKIGGGDFNSIEWTTPKHDKIRTAYHRIRNPDLKEIKRIIKSIKLMHPDTAEKKLVAYFKSLDLSVESYYASHDLRRTFITDAFDLGHAVVDIMDSVGHKDIKTTLGYRREKKLKKESIWNDL